MGERTPWAGTCVLRVGSYGSMRNIGVMGNWCFRRFSDLSRDTCCTFVLHVGSYVLQLVHSCIISKRFSS
ncbi:hypothetical protein HAX54_039037, partial [Datura stramonium]|nr:hypothetical protein [Datura stramonium]